MMRFAPILLIALSAGIAAADEGQTAPGFQAIECEGTYPHHLQGVCTDEREHLFWSFTTRLVKTDRAGKVLKQVPVANHHGDLCYLDGKISVAVNLGKFNDPEGNADSWVYIYAASNLSLLARHKTPEVFHGAGGIASHQGKLLVVGGLPGDVNENFLYEYDANFRFQKKHVLPSGQTHLGIQTAAFADGHWWFGCYGDPKILLKANESLRNVERFEFDASLGIVPIGEGRFLIGRGDCSKDKGCTGRVVIAETDAKRGLVLKEGGPNPFEGIWRTTSAQTSLILTILPDGKAGFVYIGSGNSYEEATWKEAPGGIIVDSFPRFRFWKGRHDEEARVEMESFPPELTSRSFRQFPKTFFMRRQTPRKLPDAIKNRPLPEGWDRATLPEDWDKSAGKRRSPEKAPAMP